MFQKILSLILIISFLSVPLWTHATDLGGSWAQATAFITKEFGLDLIARGIARNLLNTLTSGLINKIQTGGKDGGPTFVQNWRNFQTDAQYRGENVFRNILGSTSMCGYVDKDVKGLFGVNSNAGTGGSTGNNFTGRGNVPLGGVCRPDVSGGTDTSFAVLYDCAGEGSRCRQTKCNGRTNSNVVCTADDVCLKTEAGSSCKGVCQAGSNLITPGGITQLRPPAGQNTRVGNFDPFPLRSACTMPSSFNLDSYQKDFAGNGGWDAWSRMLEPQNNYYGLLFGSLDESARQRALEESGDLNEAQAGSGYTAIRDSCVGSGANAQCTFLGITKTPGDLLGKTAASTIDIDLQWLVSSDELSEILISVISASINRLGNLATSKTGDDYDNATSVNDGQTDAFNQCSDSCAGDQQCLLQCSQDITGLVPDLNEPEPTPGEENQVCASQEEIDQFLINNPGDEGRLSTVFPCP